MFDQMLRFLSSHQTIGALIYSWGSFEIGRMFFKSGRQKGGFLWGALGVVTAVIYFFVAIFLRQWLGVVLLAATAASEAWLMKRWLGETQPPSMLLPK
jgi:hypothetical protein